MQMFQHSNCAHFPQGGRKGTTMLNNFQRRASVLENLMQAHNAYMKVKITDMGNKTIIVSQDGIIESQYDEMLTHFLIRIGWLDPVTKDPI